MDLGLILCISWLYIYALSNLSRFIITAADLSNGSFPYIRPDESRLSSCSMCAYLAAALKSSGGHCALHQGSLTCCAEAVLNWPKWLFYDTGEMWPRAFVFNTEKVGKNRRQRRGEECLCVNICMQVVSPKSNTARLIQSRMADLLLRARCLLMWSGGF